MTETPSSPSSSPSSPDPQQPAAGESGARVTAQLSAEQRRVDLLYGRLDALRREKAEELDRVRRAATSGHHQTRSERDAFAAHYQQRLAQLEAVEQRLVFGRLDGRPPESDDDGGEPSERTRYIGRIGLADRDHSRLLVDWRARESAPFYQATGQRPMGVGRRRHLVLEGRRVTSLEDEVLDPDLLGDVEVLQGEGALLAALNSRRTGRMNDIVATIQAEQDRIIRAPLQGVRVVQGGPGTGKTAVALHRAAFLLYEHRERLRTSGVLIVGPSSSFLWYIDRVLPSLGETGVVMSSLADLFPGVHGVPEQDPRAAQLKSGLEMIKAVKRAVKDRQKVPPQDLVLHADSHRVVLSRALVRRAREKARATGKPHNQARETFVKIILQELAEDLGRELNERSGNHLDRSYLAEDLRQAPEIRRAVNLLWLPLSAETLIRQLYAKRTYLDSAFRHLSARERDVLERPTTAPLTTADVPLLDEAAELLGDLEEAGVRIRTSEAERAKATESAEKALYNMHQSLEDVGVDGVISAQDLTDYNAEHVERMTAAEAATSDRTWAYGHIVVDEAQELSPMQWRVLMRRCPLKSFTVVGDIAQAGAAAAASSWEDALSPFVEDRFTVEQLTVNYRTPAQIAQAAVRVARAAGVELAAPQAVREGEPPFVTPAGDDQDLLARTVEQVREEMRFLDGGLIAVLAPDALVPRTAAALQEALPGQVGTGMRRVDRQVIVLSTWEAKGLEFDAVVLVEPARILEEAGPGALYVAMTRPTQHLRAVAARQLPAGFVG